MSESNLSSTLQSMLQLVQPTVGQRLLPGAPFAAVAQQIHGDFERAIRKLAESPACGVGIITGFWVPVGDTRALETDGPPGAFLLAEVLRVLGYQPVLILQAEAASLLHPMTTQYQFPVQSFEVQELQSASVLSQRWEQLQQEHRIRHLIAIECVGPSHHNGRYHSMRGEDITDSAMPWELLFDHVHQQVDCHTIGIGDGGNEIGMGKLAPELIAELVPNGELIACRVATDELIWAGVSNWGAYAMVAGLLHAFRYPHPGEWLDPAREGERLQALVHQCGMVDGVTRKAEPTVDGMAWDASTAVLAQLHELIAVQQ